MTSNSVLEPPFRLSASEIASLWSEETGRSALEIREDLETWLEAFGPEDTLSRDDQLLKLMGVCWVDRASLHAYCRYRSLEFPEFLLSDTISSEKSTGRRSDGPESDHIALSGSNKGSDRGIELSPTSASESLELAARDDLVPGGENTDENVNPRLVAEQLELNRITKARLVSRRLFTWVAELLELNRITKARLVSRRLFTWGPALIVAFGVALVGWRYWFVDVEHRVIANESVQMTASRRIEKGLETQTSKEMVREDQYRTDGALLESQSRTGNAVATVKSLSSEMTQDELSIAPGNDRPAALDAQTPQADWQGEEDQRRTVAESTWKMEEEQRLTTLRATWESEEKQRLIDAQNTWQAAQEQNLEEDRMVLADEERRRLAEAESAWKATNKKHLAAAEKMWRSDEAQRLAKAQEAWAAEVQTRLAKAEAVWKEAAVALVSKNRVTQAGTLDGLAEAEATWQAKSTESLAAAEAAWKRDEEARFAAARKTWAEEAKKLAGAAARASVEAQLAAAQATWAVEEESHLAAARKSWETEAKQRQAPPTSLVPAISVAKTAKSAFTGRPGDLLPTTQRDGSSYARAGVQAQNKGAFGKAIEFYSLAIELGDLSSKNLAHVYNNRGAAYKNMEFFDLAINDYSIAIRLEKDYARAYYNRGIAFSTNGLLVEAIKDYSTALRLKPDDATTYNNRGLAYDRSGDHQKAIADFSKAIHLVPDLSYAYYNRGLAYEATNERQRAIKDFKKSYALNPNSSAYQAKMKTIGFLQ